MIRTIYTLITKILFVFVLLFTLSAVFPLVINAQTINEFVGNSSTEWVEFYNASSSAEFLKNYWIDDDNDFSSDSGSSGKKQLTSLNTSNTTYPYFELSSGIFNNTGGDSVVLFDSLGNKIDEYHYTDSLSENVSIGRSPDNTGSFYTLALSTKGSSNSGPVQTPTPSPTQNPTVTPTPTTALTTAPTPLKTPTPKPKVTMIPTPSSSPEVLGENTSEPVPTNSPTSTPITVSSKVALHIIPIVLVGLGVVSIGIPFFPVLKKFYLTKFKRYNDSNDKTD